MFNGVVDMPILGMDACLSIASCLKDDMTICTANCPPCVYSVQDRPICYQLVNNLCPQGHQQAFCYGKGIFAAILKAPAQPVYIARVLEADQTSPVNSTESMMVANDTTISSPLNNSTTPPSAMAPVGTIYAVLGCAVFTILLLGFIAYRRKVKQTRKSLTSPITHPSFLMTMDPQPPKSGTFASATTSVHQRGLAAPAPNNSTERRFTFTRSSTSTDIERRESLMSIQSASTYGYSNSIFQKNKEVMIGSSVSSSVSSVSSIFEIGRQQPRERDVLNDSFITSGLIAEEEDDGPWRATKHKDSVVMMDETHEEDDDVFDKAVEDMRETSTSTRHFSECSSVMSDISDIHGRGVARI
ncbi:hypothetical protein THRCLA_05282 [Thraustotheca clavata]|uniref:Uncharacterized protein n=1 Tax=Thraustotheca clavata TaxID=74557 RepID=A0A1V9ZWE7_9STRA|nr:hypothetical protein THRCLA_05282 [Thraustotheca clavata]